MAVTSLPEGNVTLLLTPPTLLGGPNITASPTPMSNETHQRYLRELALQEFYSTYDVWTGIRTAITLALFFVFTVTVILYKSKCKPRRKYELYPSLEDMPGRPLDYCDYWCSSPGSHDTGHKSSQVDSLGRCYNQGRGETGSAPLPTQRSIGSYSSLNNSFRVKSLPGSVMRINCSRNSSFERDDSQAMAHSVRSEFLAVPGVRLQSTGSSSDGYSQGSSLHDLSGGDMTPMALLGVPGLGPRGNKPLLQLGGMDWDSDHATAEWVQCIDINVIQPTPNVSPCGSVRSVSDNSELARLPLPVRGRAASLLSLDSPDLDSRSIGSDSVFLEDSLGDTFSSRSESVDSVSPSLQPFPHPTLTPSPRSARRKIQSFRLGINPSTSPLPPCSPVASRALPPDASPRPRDQRSRQKLLQRQRVQEESLGGVGLGAGPKRGGSPMASLAVPGLGGHLRASCERLAAHAALQGERDRDSSLSHSSGLLVPSASGSTEEEPMCAVFTVPSLRRCNSATSPGLAEEADGWKRSDSEQNPVMRRSDSANSRQRLSSESSSGSDDASESVSFHLMVPALSLDQPSADTSRASSPALSPPSSPNSTPPPARRTPVSASQSPRTLSSPFSPASTPSPTRGRGGRIAYLGVGRGNGILGNGLAPGVVGNGRAAVGRGNGRRVLRRQYSQCVPPSPTLRDVPTPPASLPTYVEEDDLEGEWIFPPAPPPSPFKAGQALYLRQDSGPPSPLLAARHLHRQDSSPTSPRSAGYHLLRQDSTPSSPQMRRQDSSASSPMPRQDSSPTPPQEKAPLNREGSSPTPPFGGKSSLTREDSSPPSSSFPSEMRDDSRHPSSSSSSSSSSSVMETPC